ncbi:WG repeat-containing protein [Pedobacter heparinus]|uniref:WG repeat-containing protein n=1 Tax=Pedobacter heparinus TaxID=984 RepID=UPI00292D6420|nr:WG repeat-containing protein [Pedobacter heparinus]
MKRKLLLCLALFTISVSAHAQRKWIEDINVFFGGLAENAPANAPIYVSYKDENVYKVENSKAESLMTFTKTLAKDTVKFNGVYNKTSGTAYSMSFVKDNGKYIFQSGNIMSKMGLLDMYVYNPLKGKGMVLSRDGFSYDAGPSVDGKVGKYYKFMKLMPGNKFFLRDDVDGSYIYGIMNQYGEFPVPLIYNAFDEFHGLFLVSKKGELDKGVIDIDHNIIMPLAYYPGYIKIEKNIIIASKSRRHGDESLPSTIYNHKGQRITTDEFHHVMDFSEGLAAVSDKNSNIGYIDEYGKLVIPMVYKNVYSSQFEGGKVELSKDGVKMFIDKQGKRIQ